MTSESAALSRQEDIPLFEGNLIVTYFVVVKKPSYYCIFLLAQMIRQPVNSSSCQRIQKTTSNPGSRKVLQ
jgi:hypothetical protein